MGNMEECWGIFGAVLFCINEEMVNRGYAWKYDGGKKTKNFDALRALRVKS